MKLNQFVNIIDIETTAWESANTKPQDEIQEIIEIGIAIVDIKNLTIVDNDTMLVKPQQSQISKFCEQLTTITQDMVDDGIFLNEACQFLEEKYFSSKRVWASWGDFDRKTFENNCKDYNIKYPFGRRHVNLKCCFAMFNGFNQELGMGEALNFLNLKMEGTHHRGLDDAKNIANIFIHMLKKFRR